MADLLYDLRTSLRNIRRRPLAATVAVVILALGLTASISVFTYANGFFQAFPGANADGLVRIYETDAETPYGRLSYLDFLDYDTQTEDVFEGVAGALSSFGASVRHETMTDVVFGEAVSGNFFSLLGIEMHIGRGISVDDDTPEATPVAVIAHSWWQRQWDADPDLLGEVIYLNYRPFIVVGVASPTYRGSTSGFRPEVWIASEPYRDRYTFWDVRARDRDIPLVRAYARLRPGVSPARGLDALERVATGLDETFPGRTSVRSVGMEPATWIDPESRLAEAPTVRLMAAATAGLLLLVCANVANLLLAVTLGRSRELAVRAAIGASPGRLVRQILTENVLLATLAGALGLALATPVTARLESYFARPSIWGTFVPREVEVDGRVLVFALVLSALTGILAGIVPALRASRRNLVATLKSDASPLMRSKLWRWRTPGLHETLVSAQVGLSVVLLVVAGLVLRTLASTQAIDPGFAYERLLASHISTSSTNVTVEGRDRFFRDVAARIAEEPWVASATVAVNAVLSPQASRELIMEGHGEPATTLYSLVLPNFFETLRMPLVEGRSFSPGDTAGASPVVIVNERLADAYFGGGSSLGRRIWWGGTGEDKDRMFEVVGVVQDSRMLDFLAEPEPMAYFAYPQHSYPSGSALIIETQGDPSTFVPELQQWLRAYEPHLAIVNVLPYSEVVRGFLYTQRMNAELFSALATLGLTLAAVGLFSVMSLAVARRTQEIGIRMAIGARRGRIGRLMVRRALTPVAVGAAVGLGAAMLLTSLAESLLFGVERTDPLTIAVSIGVLVVAALLAAYLPARRAAAVDPVVALKTN